MEKFVKTFSMRKQASKSILVEYLCNFSQEVLFIETVYTRPMTSLSKEEIKETNKNNIIKQKENSF